MRDVRRVSEPHSGRNCTKVRQRQLRGENIMLNVSDETHERTTADSVRPSSDNRHATARFGRMVARGAVRRVPGESGGHSLALSTSNVEMVCACSECPESGDRVVGLP